MLHDWFCGHSHIIVQQSWTPQIAKAHLVKQLCKFGRFFFFFVIVLEVYGSVLENVQVFSAAWKWNIYVSVTLRLTHLRNYEPNHFLTPSVLSNYNMVVSNSLWPFLTLIRMVHWLFQLLRLFMFMCAMSCHVVKFDSTHVFIYF